MFLFFDTETTGLPTDYNAHVHDVDNWPRLVQLAWISCDKKGDEQTFRNHIIRPEGFEIPNEASKVHGITTKTALKKGISLLYALIEFRVALELSTVLIAHNINFDKKIIGAEFIRKNYEDSYQRIKTIDKFCTMMKSTKYCQIPHRNNKGYKWPTLMELHQKLFKELFENAHDAMGDVSATKNCYYALLDVI